MTMTAPAGKDQPCTSNVPLPDMEGKPSKISIKVANQWYTRATITASKIRSFTQNSKHAECGGDERVTQGSLHGFVKPGVLHVAVP